MLGDPKMMRFRLDGLEAMLVAVVFIASIVAMSLFHVGLPFGETAVVALAPGLGSVWILRRVRPTRAMPVGEGEHALMRARSLLSLLLLGIGWFVLLISALLAFLLAAMLSDPKAQAPAAVLLLALPPLLLGAGLVYGGLRVGRKKPPHVKLVE